MDYKPLKPTITFDDQIDWLKNQGLIIEDESLAKEYLIYNSFYHLKIYFNRFYREPDFFDAVGSKSKKFVEGTTFNQIIQIHDDDCYLRSLLLNALQLIEIRMRSLISYEVGLKWGSAAFYSDEPFYSNKLDDVKKLRDSFKSIVENDYGNPIVRHHVNNYDSHFPLFAVFELTSLRFLKNYFCCLDFANQNMITTKYFGLKNGRELRNWLNCLNDLRNICAHHNYLYKRVFNNTPIFLNDNIVSPGNDKTLFAYCVIIGYLSSQLEWNAFVKRLQAFDSEHNRLRIDSYGFVNNWLDLFTSRVDNKIRSNAC